MTAFLLKTFSNSMPWCKSATSKIANLAILIHYMVLLNPCIDFHFFFEVNDFIWSIMKVQFNKNIHDMSQCLPNPGFMSIKVQNVEFLKKPSVENIFFSSLMFSYLIKEGCNWGHGWWQLTSHALNYNLPYSYLHTIWQFFNDLLKSPGVENKD